MGHGVRDAGGSYAGGDLCGGGAYGCQWWVAGHRHERGGGCWAFGGGGAGGGDVVLGWVCG
ncbi:hypothetical protein FFI11_010485 [Oerskovia sp. KBS0722]|nr:hypothetical protein FFI11_010485 [Oerskovia sp. KBS0722]